LFFLTDEFETIFPLEPIPMTSTPQHHLETRLVHDGTLRTGFGETSEALFLTQGFIYETAESAEARFQNEEPGFS